jgi:hypothetical protein
VGARVELEAGTRCACAAVSTVDEEAARGVGVDDDGTLAGGRCRLLGDAIYAALGECGVGRRGGE